MKNMPENLTQIIKAILPLILIIILFLFLGKIGINKIKIVRGQIKISKEDQSVLTEKLDLLKGVAVTGVQDSNAVTNALPDTNPVLAVTYQLRNLAAANGIILNSIKSTVNVNEATDLNIVTISFHILGEKSKVKSFLLNIGTIAPISILNNIKTGEAGGMFSGEISISSYWSALPTKLPDTIAEFQELTSEDKKTLSFVNSLVKPTFINLPPPETGGRPNPFAQ